MIDSYREPSLGPATSASADSARQRFEACAEAGVLRLAVDAAYGGLGNGFADLVDAHFRLGRATRDPGLVLALNAHVWGAVFPLITFGTADQHARWLPGLLDGSVIAGHAISEPHAGSDVQAMTTTASRSDDGFLLNGTKRFITNTPLANLMVVYARVDEPRGVSAFIIDAGDAGATFADAPSVNACRTATMGDVVLEHCHLSADRRLGSDGAGAIMIQSALERERAFIFAGITGVMRWQLDHVVEHARRRSLGVGRLADAPVIAHKLADMKLRLDTATLWVKRCAELCDAGQRLTLASAQTKLFASEAFLQSCLDAVQILGAHGLDETMTQLVDDAMAGRLFSGSSEIQKNIIGAMMGVGLEPKKRQ